MISNISLPVQSVLYKTEEGWFGDCVPYVTLGNKLAKCEARGYVPIAILETTDPDALLCATWLFVDAIKEDDHSDRLMRKARFAGYMEELAERGIALTVACPDVGYPLPDSWKKAFSIKDLTHEALPVDLSNHIYKGLLNELGFSDEDIAHLESMTDEDLRRLLEEED